MSSDQKGASSTISMASEVGFGGALPEGSSLFQEVMAELSPRPKTPEPRPKPTRRTSRQEKHVHIVTEQDLNEAKMKDKPPEHPQHQILHGLCHCYYVQNGEVMGIADKRCQHHHRKQTSPASSPRLQRKNLSSGMSPDGSPTAQRKLQNSQNHHHHHHHNPAMLMAPHLGEFRSRSHSDTSAMTRRMKKTSIGNRNQPNSSGSKQDRAGAATDTRHQTTSPKKDPSSSERPAPVRRVSSFRQTSSTAPGSSTSPTSSSSSSRPSTVSTPVRRRSLSSAVPHRPNSPPTSVLVQEPIKVDDQEVQLPPRRKISTHLTPSEELHFLYDQFLRPSSDAASASGRQRSQTVGALP